MRVLNPWGLVFSRYFKYWIKSFFSYWSKVMTNASALVISCKKLLTQRKTRFQSDSGSYKNSSNIPLYNLLIKWIKYYFIFDEYKIRRKVKKLVGNENVIRNYKTAKYKREILYIRYHLSRVVICIWKSKQCIGKNS